MPRQLPWTLAEFRVVLSEPTLSHQELSDRLPGRSPDSIEVVRVGIHNLHLGRDDGFLSELLKAELCRAGGTCPRCREVIEPSAEH